MVSSLRNVAILDYEKFNLENMGGKNVHLSQL